VVSNETGGRLGELLNRHGTLRVGNSGVVYIDDIRNDTIVPGQDLFYVGFTDEGKVRLTSLGPMIEYNFPEPVTRRKTTKANIVNAAMVKKARAVFIAPGITSEWVKLGGSWGGNIRTFDITGFASQDLSFIARPDQGGTMSVSIMKRSSNDKELAKDILSLVRLDDIPLETNDQRIGVLWISASGEAIFQQEPSKRNGKDNFVRLEIVNINGDLMVRASNGTSNSVTLRDNAMATDLEANESAPGGIDLNAANMGMKVQKDANGGVKIDIDPALIERIKREGVQSMVPVIIQMTPIADIRPLLGLSSPSLTNS
jgi:hypothetical protein